ncbi:hypothetical protein Tco_0413532 [Tanacetum coccineum]
MSKPPSGTPLLLPIPLPTLSPPLLLPSTDCKAGICEVTLPPRKRLCIALGESPEDYSDSSADRDCSFASSTTCLTFIACGDTKIDEYNTDTAMLFSLLSIMGNSRLKMAPKRATRSTLATITTTTSVTNAQLKALIDQGVANALVACDANRSRNGKDSHDSGTGVRRQAPPARECTYLDFMKCKPLYLKGTEGVVELT